MRTFILLLILSFSLVGLTACDSSEPEPEPQPTVGELPPEPSEEADDEAAAPEAESELVERARELGALASAIEAEPDRVEELLSEAGLTEDELELELFAIAEDSEANAALLSARRGQ